MWFGITVENCHIALVDLPELAEIPSPVRFISCEPLLSSVVDECEPFMGAGIDWVIVGGERTNSPGRKTRVMHPGWVTELHTLAMNKDVPFYLKDWGDWQPAEERPARSSAKNRLVKYGHARRKRPVWEMRRCRKGSDESVSLFGEIIQEFPFTGA